MESDLLRKEREFREENEKLELETRMLMQKVEGVMKIQDNLIKEPLKVERNHGFSSTTDLNLPKSVDQMGTKGMLHFYKAKLTTMQTDHEKLQSELKNKNDEFKKLQKDNQICAEEKEKWFLQFNSEKNNSIKLQKQIQVFTSQLQFKDNEILSLKKEVELLKSELKSTNNVLSSAEGKISNVVLENNKIKVALATAKQKEKESKEFYQKELKELNTTLRTLQKHKMELLHGYKKQIQLIDNLKKQKALLESAKITEIAETEFLKLLNWKLD